MWVAKIKISGENAMLGSRARKFDVSLSGYPVSFYEKKDGIYVSLVCFIFGEQKNKKKFVDDLKKEKRIVNVEGKGDFLIAQIKEPVDFKVAYRHQIIHLEPVIIKEDATETWTLGSWNKKDLTEFVDLVKKTHDGQLLKIRQETITNFSIISMHPELTHRQKKAIEVAVENGYYEHPRKTELKELAMAMSVSYSTYQAHLRKAEQKLLPFFFARMK